MDNSKEVTAMCCSSIRELVNFINTKNLKREDVWDIIPNEGSIFLLYYK